MRPWAFARLRLHPLPPAAASGAAGAAEDSGPAPRTYCPSSEESKN